MARQIAVVASPADERSLLVFLREVGPVRLCVRAATTIAELFPDEFPPYHHTRELYYLWNQAFHWSPRVVQPTPGGGGMIENLEVGPVIEFRRSAMHMFAVDRGVCLGRGRIYWAQRNRHKGFETWYDRVAGWVRRNGENLSTRGSACYCLPDALRTLQAKHRHAEPGATADGGA